MGNQNVFKWFSGMVPNASHKIDLDNIYDNKCMLTYLQWKVTIYSLHTHRKKNLRVLNCTLPYR